MTNATDIPPDSTQDSADQFVELDLLGREFRRSSPQAELASLREFNSKLLERIGEFRKRNFELSASESGLRKSLALRDEECTSLRRELSEKTGELERLHTELDEQVAIFEESKTEMNRSVARLSDQKWSDDLEIETLKARDAGHKDEIERLKAELIEIPLLRAELRERINAEATKAAQLAEANDLLADLEQEVENGKTELQNAVADSARALAVERERQAQLGEAFAARETQAADAFKAREAQLLGAFENLRAEYASIDKCYKEAIEAVTHLRLEGEAGARRLGEAQRQIAALSAEIARQRQLLQTVQAEDTRIENECRKLQISQERVSYLDQHLRQIADGTKRDKLEVLRIAKVLAQELHVARTHPAHDYLRAVELEVAHLQTALSATSGLSPARTKIETRLAQAMEHRETLKALIATSDRQHEERFLALQSIIKSANS